MTHPGRPASPHRGPARAQRGVATLVVVMVLLFIASMVAAYSSRNMIFEQRTGTNLYRASQALEAAEAGMDWALTMLNQGRIDANCAASTDTANNSFRERYLTFNAISGGIGARTAPGGGALAPTCVFDAATNRWVCSCPADAVGAPPAPAGTGAAPAFRVRFRTPTGVSTPGLVRIDVVGCTRLADDCLVMNDESVVNEGRAVIGSIAYITGRNVALPRAALTARGAVTPASPSALGISNVRVEDGGVTVHASGTIASGLTLTTLAGSPQSGSTLEDPALSSAALGSLDSRERFFAAVFQLPTARWRQQPAYVEVDCRSGCTDNALRAAVAAGPGRPIWVEGNLTIEDDAPIGSVSMPVMLVVNGHLRFDDSTTIHGLVFVRPPDPVAGWAIDGSGAGTVRGALVVDGSVVGSGALNVAYDGMVLDALQSTNGSLVRLPGSWRDWRMP